MAQPGRQAEDVDVRHGNSVAAWVCVTVMMVGALVGAIAVGAKSVSLGVTSVVVVVVGVVLGKVLQAASYGIRKP
jgi:hypothetical protein